MSKTTKTINKKKNPNIYQLSIVYLATLANNLHSYRSQYLHKSFTYLTFSSNFHTNFKFKTSISSLLHINLKLKIKSTLY